jgi:hypothetical protein
VARELWEIVRADQLKPNDVAAFGSVDELYRFVPSQVKSEVEGVLCVVAETDDTIQLRYAFLREEPVLRLVSGLHLNSIWRALAGTVARLNEIDWESKDLTVDQCIEQARKEMESEEPK